jgi:hypothetical protein
MHVVMAYLTVYVTVYFCVLGPVTFLIHAKSQHLIKIRTESSLLWSINTEISCIFFVTIRKSPALSVFYASEMIGILYCELRVE